MQHDHLLTSPSSQTGREPLRLVHEPSALKPTKLTARVLAKLQPGQRRRDTAVRGFFAEAHGAGISFKLQADLWKGQRGRRTFVRTVRQTLGRFPELGIDEARQQAMALLAQIKAGVDPRPAPSREPAAPSPVMTVAAMFALAAESMRTNQRAARSVAELEYMLSKYLPHLASTPVCEVKPSMLRAEHKRITAEHGPVVANHAMRAYRSAFNTAKKRADDPDVLGDNPTRAVDFHPERKREASIAADDLTDWYERIQALPNPLRRIMHELGLFSGLRPGTLVAIERAWVQLEDRRIVIPRARMKVKQGEPFVLPLSEHMAGLVGRALMLSDEIERGSPWLFPTRSADGRTVKATQVWRERKMLGETGHILRKTYRTQATVAGVPKALARMLMDHAVRDIEAHYENPRDLFATLLRRQEQVTAHLLGLLSANPAADASNPAESR